MSAVAVSPGVSTTELRRQLHDGVLQLLEYMACGGWGRLSATPEYRALAAEAARDLRAIVDADDPEGELGSSLRAMADRASRIAGNATVRIDIELSCEQLPARDVAPVLHAAREALTNAARHAAAANIVVSATRTAGGVVIEVVDDGVGCDWRRVRPGFGMRRSIVDRMLEAGGVVQLFDGDTGGTRVYLELPLAAEVAATIHEIRPNDVTEVLA